MSLTYGMRPWRRAPRAAVTMFCSEMPNWIKPAPGCAAREADEAVRVLEVRQCEATTGWPSSDKRRLSASAMCRGLGARALSCAVLPASPD